MLGFEQHPCFVSEVSGWDREREKAININLQFSLHLSGAYLSKRLSACRDMGGYLNGASQRMGVQFSIKGEAFNQRALRRFARLPAVILRRQVWPQKYSPIHANVPRAEKFVEDAVGYCY